MRVCRLTAKASSSGSQGGLTASKGERSPGSAGADVDSGSATDERSIMELKRLRCEGVGRMQDWRRALREELLRSLRPQVIASPTGQLVVALMRSTCPATPLHLVPAACPSSPAALCYVRRMAFYLSEIEFVQASAKLAGAEHMVGAAEGASGPGCERPLHKQRAQLVRWNALSCKRPCTGLSWRAGRLVAQASELEAMASDSGVGGGSEAPWLDEAARTSLAMRVQALELERERCACGPGH